MNAFTKFVAMPMRGHGNVTEPDVIMRWQTDNDWLLNRGTRYNQRVLHRGCAGTRGHGLCVYYRP